MAPPRLQVQVPRDRVHEREYAARVVLRDLLGFEPVIRSTDTDRVLIRAGSETTLVVADGLFATAQQDWLRPSSLPREPLQSRDVAAELPEARLADRLVPLLYPNGDGPQLHRDAATGEATLDLDVFGGAFFALTRYEEVAARGVTRDGYGRFPGTASLAHRAGFLKRPLADEYAEVLRAALRRVWPRLPDLRAQAGVWLTHDVDRPFVGRGGSLSRVARAAVGDVAKRRSPRLAARRLRAYSRRSSNDPADTFDFLMSVAERAGLRSTFTFLAGGSAPQDGRYSLADPAIARLLRRIHDGGHELGFHGSYEAFADEARLRGEFQGLLDTAYRLGIDQSAWGGRQHYLRWHNPTTWQAWSDAGLTFDSTIGFADLPGFRSGSCRPHRTFNLLSRTELPLVERPLTLMDTTAGRYLGLSADETVDRAARLSAACKAVGGTFVLLWHNDAVMTPASRQLYERVVEAIR